MSSFDEAFAARINDATAIDPFSFLKPAAPAAQAVEPERIKSAQELHDEEVAWRNGYINNPNTASFFWAVERSGTVIAAEYDACDCKDGVVSPIAHRNHFVDIPGTWFPVVVGIADTFDRDHNPISVPVTIPAFAASMPFGPFTFHAVPVTLDHQALAPQSVEIEPGMKIVYGHRTRTNESTGGAFYVDSLIFGRILSDGTQEIKQVYAGGDVFSHSSIDEAHLHEHISFKVPE